MHPSNRAQETVERLERLPNELQTRVWKTYVQIHVLPEVRSCYILPLRTLVRTLRDHGNDPNQLGAILKQWGFIIKCRFLSLDDARDHLHRAFPDTVSFGCCFFENDTLYWTFEGNHTFSARIHWTLTWWMFVTYHGPATGTGSDAGVGCFVFEVPEDTRSVNLGRTTTVRSLGGGRLPMHSL